MSGLRDAALAAKTAHDELEAAKERTRKHHEGVDRVERSPLGEWFQDVQWEFVGNLTNGTTLVREKDGLDLLLGAKFLEGAAPGQSAWEVAVYTRIHLTMANQYKRELVLKEASDLGVYIHNTDPKAEPQ